MYLLNTSHVILLNENRILMTKEMNSKQPKGVYSLPGGVIEKTDSNPETTAIRELYEETGIKTEELENLGTYYTIMTRDFHDTPVKINLFYCRNFCGNLKSSDETVPEWIELDKFFRGVPTALKDDYFYDILVAIIKRNYNISETE